MVEQLRLKKQQGRKTGIFGDGEIQNIFTLFDLKNEGWISKERAKEALKVLANSEHQFTAVEEKQIPEKVDGKEFQRLW